MAQISYVTGGMCIKQCIWIDNEFKFELYIMWLCNRLTKKERFERKWKLIQN